MRFSLSSEKSTVKTRRREQDVPLYVFRLEQAKQLPLKRGDTSKPDNVLHSISAFRLTETNKLTDNPPFISPLYTRGACLWCFRAFTQGGLLLVFPRLYARGLAFGTSAPLCKRRLSPAPLCKGKREQNSTLSKAPLCKGSWRRQPSEGLSARIPRFAQ